MSMDTTMNDLITDPDLNSLINQLGLGDVSVLPMSALGKQKDLRPQEWMAEDGYLILYFAQRDDNGDFRVITMKPMNGKRGDKKRTATHWKRNYERTFRTRKAAKKRALKLFADHSPKWAARNAWWLESQHGIKVK